MGAGSAHLSVPLRGHSVAALERQPRRGYMLFEVQVAFVLLGIGLAGLCPLVVMQLRQVRQLEMRFRGQMIETSRVTGLSQTMVIMTNGVPLPPATYYIVPWQNPWARKLTGSAQIVELASIPPSVPTPCDPGSLSTNGNSPAFIVTVISGPVPVPGGPPYSYSVNVDVTTPTP
jgi:hypothetical protein